jgi:hypothetical protein
LSLGGVPIAGGTDLDFCELNRNRPDADSSDGMFWSLNPTVHAVDDLSVLETPEAFGEQVRTARTFAAGQPLFVGPVTFRRRRNANAVAAEERGADGLPDSVDPRQAALLGAVWTAAIAKHLVEQGAAAVTCFEAVGWGGVVQGDKPPAMPFAFPARPGQVFPLYHVLADVCELRGADVLMCGTTRPIELAGLAVRRGDETTLIVANLTSDDQFVAITGIAGGGRLRRLDMESAERADFEPETFRSSRERVQLDGLELAPYATVRIDVDHGEEDA